jgi:hypothetical protein
MTRDTTVIPFRQPDAIDDPLTEIAVLSENHIRTY